MKIGNINLDDVLSSSWALWLISIITSVVMWVYVTGMEERQLITRKFSMPLEYRGLDAQAMLRGRLSEVDVEVRGTEDAMMRLDYNSINAFVDARNLIPGKKYTVNIIVETPPDITLLSCFPSQAVLDIVRQVTRLMNVETVLPQNIPEGQYIEGVEILPREVGVRGAEDDVLKVGAVRITPTVEELQEGKELYLTVKFSQSEPFEGAVKIEPEKVRFKATLARGLPKKRVPVNVRLTGKLDADYEVKSITTDPSEIQIEGSRENLAKIETVDTEIIDVSLMAEDKIIVVPLKALDVEGVSFVSGASVKVSLQLSETRAEKMLTNIPVEIRGTEEPDKWKCNPSNVSVTIEGRPSFIEKLSAENMIIKSYVDMSNIFMAPVTLPVKAETISDDLLLKITKIEPNNVTVTSL